MSNEDQSQSNFLRYRSFICIRITKDHSQVWEHDPRAIKVESWEEPYDAIPLKLNHRVTFLESEEET